VQHSSNRRCSRQPRATLALAIGLAASLALTSSALAADPVLSPERFEDFSASDDRSPGGAVSQSGPSTQAQLSVAPGSIGVSSWTYWVDGLGYLNIVGDVHNRTSSRNAAVVQARLFNAQGHQVGPAITIDPYSRPIAAGARSPFAHYQLAPAGFRSVRLTLEPIPWTGGPMHGPLRVFANPPRTDVGGDRHYTGTLRNEASFTVSEWIVSVGLYDSAGRLINAWHDYRAQAIAPGRSAAFTIVLPDHFAGASAHLYQAQGISADYNRLAVTWDNYFDDIGSTAFRGDIIWLAQSGITGGCAAGRFCPTAKLTRGQMAAFLDRALSLKPTSIDFFDDDETSIFEGSINRLAASGITGGCATRRFCPNASLTRGQMAAFLDRALKLKATSIDFFDDDETSIFEGSINRLAAAGITGGCATRKFCPDGVLSRAEMAAFLRRGLK
jgi:hypothetical protein